MRDFATKIENILKYCSGAQVWVHQRKTRGRKFRGTVPLIKKKINHSSIANMINCQFQNCTVKQYCIWQLLSDETVLPDPAETVLPDPAETVLPDPAERTFAWDDTVG